MFRYSGRWFLCLFVLVTACLASARENPESFVVKVAYVIPSDRQPTPDYNAKIARVLGWVRAFYADQMEAQGFGRMTFTLEPGAGNSVNVHLIKSPMTAAVFADTGHARYVTGKYWQHAEAALKDVGFHYQRGEIWLVFAEAQDQLEDGSIHNGTSQGAGVFGSGMCLMSSTVLSLATPEALHDLHPYEGLVLPAIGPHPLKFHVSFPSYEGDFVSSLAGDLMGALTHELGHSFLLQHCFLNDETLNGNLMGNGFRGWRGYEMPEKCPEEDIRLDRPSAIMLSLSPFFHSGKEPIKPAEPPKVTLNTSAGAMKLEDGKLKISFNATATKGVTLAVLQNATPRDGAGVVAWMEFTSHPTTASGTLETTIVTPGADEPWRLRVFDASGNFTDREVKLKAPKDGFGPQPSIRVLRTRVKVGSSVSFTAHLAQADPLANFTWSFGDESSATGEKVDHAFTKPGLYEVKLTTVDVARNRSEISQFISVRK